MKTIQKKKLVQVLLGFLLGRVSIYGMNPVAPAFFAAGFAEGGAVLPVAITILGMSTVFALDTVLAYGAGMLALWLAADFLKRRRITVKMGHAAFLLAAATWVMSGTRYLLVPYSGTSIFLATLEAVLMLAVTWRYCVFAAWDQRIATGQRGGHQFGGPCRGRIMGISAGVVYKAIFDGDYDLDTACIYRVFSGIVSASDGKWQ